MAFSHDLRRWDTPQRLVFQNGPASGDPAEGTENVVPLPREYLMLLESGVARFSPDLRVWGPPRRVLPQDARRHRLLKTGDGALWAVHERPSDERQPYTPDDWWHGYFVVDGRAYRHATEVSVSRSTDGIRWKSAGSTTFPGQPSALVAFPVSDREIGIGLTFNNLFAKWLVLDPVGGPRQIESSLRVMPEPERAHCFAHEQALVCVRPVFDPRAQQAVLLATRSRALYERFTRR